MDKNQTSQGTHASVLSTANRPIYWARFLPLLLFLVLGLTSLQAKSSAHPAGETWRGGKASLASHHLRAAAKPDCAQECQQAYVECLASGGRFCGALFDGCLEGCPMTK